MATTLGPGRCLEVAIGRISPDAGAIELTIATSVNANNTKIPVNVCDVPTDLTIVHFWGMHPSNSSATEPSMECTVPAYESVNDIQGVVIEPTSFTCSLSNKHLVRSFSYTIGCGDVPRVVGDGLFYVQVWGQSHKSRSADGQWTPLSQPFGFNRVVVGADKNGSWADTFGFDKSGVEPTNCTTKTSDTAPRPRLFKWSNLLTLGALALATMS